MIRGRAAVVVVAVGPDGRLVLGIRGSDPWGWSWPAVKRFGRDVADDCLMGWQSLKGWSPDGREWWPAEGRVRPGLWRHGLDVLAPVATWLTADFALHRGPSWHPSYCWHPSTEGVVELTTDRFDIFAHSLGCLTGARIAMVWGSRQPRLWMAGAPRCATAKAARWMGEHLPGAVELRAHRDPVPSLYWPWKRIDCPLVRVDARGHALAGYVEALRVAHQMTDYSQAVGERRAR